MIGGWRQHGRDKLFWKTDLISHIVLHLLQADPFTFALFLLQWWCLSGAWHWLLSSGWLSPGCADVPVLMLISRAASGWIGTLQTSARTLALYLTSLVHRSASFLGISSPCLSEKGLLKSRGSLLAADFLGFHIPLKLALNVAVDCCSLSPITKDQVSMVMASIY